MASDNWGGARPGAGRRKGSVNSVTLESRAKAMETGLLPHEWLLSVMRGEPQKQKILFQTKDEAGIVISEEWIEKEYYPEFDVRVDCGKAAAPYYAPKLTFQEVDVTGDSGGVMFVPITNLDAWEEFGKEQQRKLKAEAKK